MLEVARCRNQATDFLTRIRLEENSPLPVLMGTYGYNAHYLIVTAVGGDDGNTRGAAVTGQGELLAVEIFAAKDADVTGAGVFLAVPRKCGLWEADTLRINGLAMVALQRKSIMPIDFPPLTESVREKLVAWAATRKPLPVAEFMAHGLYDAYYLNVLVVS